jgi:hypothetical protein
MNPDNPDSVAAPAEWLAAIREAPKRRYRDEHPQTDDARVDNRQQPAPATPRNSHIHREAWLHDVAASLAGAVWTPWSADPG